MKAFFLKNNFILYFFIQSISSNKLDFEISIINSIIDTLTLAITNETSFTTPFTTFFY